MVDLAYSPWDLLPAPVPSTVNPDESYFYSNVVKHLIPTTIRLMNTGLPIDLNRVEQLETELDQILLDVHATLAANSHIQTYLQSRYASQIAAYQAAQSAKLKLPSDFSITFDHKKPEHRSYFMHLYALSQSLPLPADTLPTGISKWSSRDVQKLSASRPILQRLLAGQLRPSETQPAIDLLTQHKADLRNKSTRDKINSPNIAYPTFNPASPIQKGELMDQLGLKSEATSKTTGADKWDRAQLERLLKEATDPAIIELLQALIDFSFAAIVRNNFIEAFYNYTVDGRLMGTYRLYGTKTFRLTSNNPNLLNLPSTNSKFAKPIKRCLIAPEGFIIATADYSALENRVIANLANEQTLIKLYADNLDGHCVNALYYFREEIAQHIPLTGDLTTDARLFADSTDTNPALKAIRQRGKGPSFGLQYGAYPPKIASTIKCSIEEATTIFNRYHNELYPAVTNFRENYVQPTAETNGKLHLGLGAYIKTDNPRRDIRTITNSCSQFWSILTLLSIHKMNQLIDEAGLQDDIKCISTIYDSVYYQCRKDPVIIQWLNTNLMKCMLKPFIDNQICPNDAALDIGPDWSLLKGIPHNASITHIQEILDGFETLHS